MSEAGNDAGNGAEQRRASASEAELAADLKPAGTLERMMIQQMARAHDTSLACFDRAEAAGESTAREAELRLAARFMALFMQQVGALDRRRAQARQAEEAGRRAAFERDCTRTEAMIGGMEGFLKQVAEPRAEPLVAAPPTPEPEPPLNRQQRRALAKRQRKAQKRLANAA